MNIGPSLVRILVVDDNLYESKLQEEILSEQGYQVVKAANGREALDILEHEKVSLIVSDILMPEMDGFTFCREVKQRENLASIPFIFYTASYVDEKDKELAGGLGADLYLIKPVPMDEYISAVKGMLEKKAASPPEEKLEESAYLQKYSERVVKKLEEKILELEQAYQIIQKEKENLLAANVKLMELDRSRTAFFSRISHELKTPLAGIIGYADILTAEISGEQKKYIEEISRYGHSLDKLLSGIMEYMDYAEGKTPLYLEKFNPEEMVRQIYDQVTTLAKSKGLQFQNNISALPAIQADRPSFLKILTNLIQNGIKFTPSGGTVTLSAEKQPGYLAISVADTGIGIRQEDQKRIFAGFEQAEDYLTRTHGGIGLGLTLTQKLIELNGGKISLQSEFGKGSTFTVFFPLAE